MTCLTYDFSIGHGILYFSGTYNQQGDLPKASLFFLMLLCCSSERDGGRFHGPCSLISGGPRIQDQWAANLSNIRDLNSMV